MKEREEGIEKKGKVYVRREGVKKDKQSWLLQISPFFAFSYI